MTADHTELDAHEQPSDELRAVWKALSKADQSHLLGGPDIDDPRSEAQRGQFSLAGQIPAEWIAAAFSKVTQADHTSEVKDSPIYFHPLLPGLLIVPSLLPPDIQKVLLSRMIHRDLSNPNHQTNMHLHFELPYPDGTSELSRSFFSHPPDSPVRFAPKDPSVHKPLSMRQVLDRRLHWLTLGGQYDWTNRVYPGSPPPSFPSDLAAFLESLFPETLAQAAIVNFYSPGDTMMMHRDVSEETDKGLVSLSFGCDCLFMIAPNDIGKKGSGAGTGDEDKDGDGDGDGDRNRDGAGGAGPQDGDAKGDAASEGKKRFLLLRLRSGDAIYMTKDSRYAWHGVPKILKGTCPDYLADWPAGDGRSNGGSEGGEFEGWRGWMRNKRINLNVRQMRD